jgi:hypothetical protein
MIAQVEWLISTTTPLPENRTERCVELLREASALAADMARGAPQPKMDEAAYDDAAPELEQNWKSWNVQQLAMWWLRWYPRAGHRRLGRMLMEITGVKPSPGTPLSPEDEKLLGG